MEKMISLLTFTFSLMSNQFWIHGSHYSGEPSQINIDQIQQKWLLCALNERYAMIHLMFNFLKQGC